MVIGIGIDIIEIDRIKKSVDEYGDQYLQKVYTPDEIKYCLAKKNKYQHLAARFAAKEAIYKAISSNWSSEFGWQDMEIINAPNGMPEVKFKGNLEKFLSNEKSLKISMSHSRDYVACVAIVYKSS